MDLKLIKSNKCVQTSDLDVFLLFDDKNIDLGCETLNLLKSEFDAKASKIEKIKVLKENKFNNILLVGMGKESELDLETVKNIGGDITRACKKENVSSISIRNFDDISLEENQVEALAEGLLLGNYEFNKYKTDKKDSKLNTINLHTDKDINKNIENGKLLAEATIIARELINEPANVLYPKTLANKVVELGKEYGFETEIYGKEKIEDLNMKSFLSVAKGSSKEPKFIVMRYKGNPQSDDKLGLVGKGLTYDSGGYSIKPTSGMVDMKGDMGGAGAVIGAMCAIAKAKLNKNVIAVVAACENLISGKAYKPGDIINSMGGKTIEVTNTDAEGRLTLIDAVYYIIHNENVNSVVDVATLTGAAVVALGTVASAIVTNDDNLYNKVEIAANLSTEKIWRMPVFDEYKKILKGKEADLNNSPGRDGGCITAGLFIGEFVGETPWVHIDIAGTSGSSKDSGYKSKGATGECARTLYNLAKLY